MTLCFLRGHEMLKVKYSYNFFNKSKLRKETKMFLELKYFSIYSQI